MGCVSSLLEAKREIEKQTNSEQIKGNPEYKILLLGIEGCGKSTILKQMKIMQDNGGYSREELLPYQHVIFYSCIKQMKRLVDLCVELGIEVSDKSALQRMSAIPETDSWSIPVANDIRALWRDTGIRSAFVQRDKYSQLHNYSRYFLDNIDRFMEDKFVPTHDDVLRAYGRTTGLVEAKFTFEDAEFSVYDVGGCRSERSKWIHCFGNVAAVIFCVSLNGYDEVLREVTSQNYMEESLMVFDELVNSHWFKNSKFFFSSFLTKLICLKRRLNLLT